MCCLGNIYPWGGKSNSTQTHSIQHTLSTTHLRNFFNLSECDEKIRCQCVQHCKYLGADKKSCKIRAKYNNIIY